MVDVVILGAGFMGKTHSEAYAALGERVRVTGVYSRSAERAARVAEIVAAEPTTDLAAASADPRVDAVDVCLPTFLHREASEQALATGKHVLVEKPIALAVEDAEAMVRAAERSGRVLMVALVLRFWPEHVELERRVRAGELGRPLAVSASRLSPPPDWNDWMLDPALSGGPAVDLLVHDFDQMSWLLGPPRRVAARAAAGGLHVHAVVEHEQGEGIAEGSLAMPASHPFTSVFRVLCEHGVAEYLYRSLPVEGVGNVGGESEGGLTLYPAGGEAQAVPLPETDGWQAELGHFLDCVERGSWPAQGTPEQAIEALRVSLAANRSIASGRPERV